VPIFTIAPQQADEPEITVRIVSVIFSLPLREQ
jgi:hypothetical protein